METKKLCSRLGPVPLTFILGHSPEHCANSTPPRRIVIIFVAIRSWRLTVWHILIDAGQPHGGILKKKWLLSSCLKHCSIGKQVTDYWKWLVNCNIGDLTKRAPDWCGHSKQFSTPQPFTRWTASQSSAQRTCCTPLETYYISTMYTKSHTLFYGNCP